MTRQPKCPLPAHSRRSPRDRVKRGRRPLVGKGTLRCRAPLGHRPVYTWADVDSKFIGNREQGS